MNENSWTHNFKFMGGQQRTFRSQKYSYALEAWIIGLQDESLRKALCFRDHYVRELNLANETRDWLKSY